MKINKAKASSYDTVKNEYIVNYIKNYTENIADYISRFDLEHESRTELKAIASELETVVKRLRYICERIY